jgi:signal transduction histidine kinase
LATNIVLARVDSGAEVLRSENFDVALLVRDACTRSASLAQAKQIHLETHLPGPVVVHGDARMLQRLFLSLIDNAIKYTPSGGRVHLSMRTEAADLIVTVQDTGIGISKEDLPFVFDRFYGADKVRSREVGGAGLGLSIARWIAEAHRGSVRAESALGEGSVFEVRIPRAEVG